MGACGSLGAGTACAKGAVWGRMYRIGVLSDTHIPHAVSKLPARIIKALEGVELILHAGDLVDLQVLDDLEAIAPTAAVCGNMDEAELCRRLPRMKILNLDRFRIGLTHGWGAARGLAERIITGLDCGSEPLDLLVFGHSHQPYEGTAKGVRVLNPGSPTDQVFAVASTVAFIEIGAELNTRIVAL